MSKKTITITQGRNNLFKIAEELQKPDTFYEFTISGTPQVVLMSKEEFDSIMETIGLLSDADILKDIRQAEKDYKKGRYSDWEDVKRKLALIKEPALVLREKPKKKYGRKKK